MKRTMQFKSPMFAEVGKSADLLINDEVMARTSPVLNIDYDPPTGAIMRVETENTIYVKEAANCGCGGCACSP